MVPVNRNTMAALHIAYSNSKSHSKALNKCVKQHKQLKKPCCLALYEQWYKTDKASEHSNSIQWTYCIDFAVNL